MKFLILNTDYPEFLNWLYAEHPGLEDQPYGEQMRKRMESFFFVADFYSSNLRKLGHEAIDIHANNEFMQRAWADEHGLSVQESPRPLRWWRHSLQNVQRVVAPTPLRHLKPLFFPLLRSLHRQPSWFYNILAAQIKHYSPDVLLNQAMYFIGGRFLKEMRPYSRLVVGQIASRLPQDEDFSSYDLIISSLPNFVEHFRQEGVPSELHRLAFEPRVLSRLMNEESKIPVSFVGSLTRQHTARFHFLEYACSRLDVEVWGEGVEGLARKSVVRPRYKGRAWGIGMYQVLYNSKITLNHHIDVAGSYANNLRLFEATGVGALLITDWKVNLREMFEPCKEVVAYRSPEECVEFIRHYLEHDDERRVIARAGQERTLREHTYYHRMQELEEIILRRLQKLAGRSEASAM